MHSFFMTTRSKNGELISQYLREASSYRVFRHTRSGKPYKHEHGRKYWHYFLRMVNHPTGWPLLYETPLWMNCLYGKVMLQCRRRTCTAYIYSTTVLTVWGSSALRGGRKVSQHAIRDYRSVVMCRSSQPWLNI